MTTYHNLNALVNLYDAEGHMQLGKDKEAAKAYFLEHINPNTVYFGNLREKLDYLVENGYYESEVLGQYDFESVKSVFQHAYSYKFRFPSFLGAYKFFTSYALKTFDGERFLERYEDRVTLVALYLARGNTSEAKNIVTEIITGRFQPATPTFLNAGKQQRGEMVSCFLMDVQDNMESIGRAINSSLQLSKRGGGVALSLTNIREEGAPIKKIEGQSSGVIPVMKMLEDAFSYANQLGSRQGAGAVYLHAHHPDILKFLDTKRENADEKLRIKTLSLGVVIPDITFDLARSNKDMYLFSPYDVERIYGKPFAYVNVSEIYYDLVDNPEIRKKKINARDFLQTLAEVQFESGYPYIMFEDAVNRSHQNEGKVVMSNLCVTGDTRLLTDRGYRRVDDLYESQEDFSVQVDDRARLRYLPAEGAVSVQESTRMFKTAENADVYRLTTKEGHEIKATEWHKFYVVRDGDLVKIPLAEVEVGDKVLTQGGKSKTFGEIHNPDLAYLWGVWAADGTTNNGSAVIYLCGDKTQYADQLTEAIHNILSSHKNEIKSSGSLRPEFNQRGKGSADLYLSSGPLMRVFEEWGVLDNKSGIPNWIWGANEETQQAFINGYWSFDGGITGSNSQVTMSLGTVNYKFAQDMQLLLSLHGVYSRVAKGQKAGFREFNVGDTLKKYPVKAMYYVRVGDILSRRALYSMVNWKKSVHDKWEAKALATGKNTRSTHKFRATVASIEYVGKEDVYDVTVDNGNSVIFNGIATGNCSEISQVTTPSEFNEDLSYAHVGRDIQCNLASLNVANVMSHDDPGDTIATAVRALSAVTDMSKMASVPSIAKGNEMSRAIGLGQMNLHGYFASAGMEYGSPESIAFTDAYFRMILFHTLTASMELAKETGSPYADFEKSRYASGEFFDDLIDENWKVDPSVAHLFGDIHLPNNSDWETLKHDVMEHGLYNAFLQAVPPTGSISYLNHATASIHPVTAPVEIRKEGKLGRVYYPAPGLTEDNMHLFKDAYEIGPEKIIDVYSAAQKYVDQSLSLTLFFKDDATTRDLNRAQIYAWRKGIKTLYYVRLRQMALSGTEVEGCVSCAL